MSVQEFAKVAPAVEFEEIELEDRDATIAKGEFVGKPVDIIKVMPQGSKDIVERIYADWLAVKRDEAGKERFPAEWLRQIEAKYAAWKKGTPVPTFGTPLKDWPHATPQLLKAMRAVNISTIEELASANEDTIRRLGMGARTLKAKAELYMNQQPIPENFEIKA